MNLIIDSDLCEPPSEVTCFRDVTLYGKIFIFEDVLLRCRTGTRSLYWNWLKAHGAHDFVSALILDHEVESGFKISPSRGNLSVDRINAFNLNSIISRINSIKNHG